MAPWLLVALALPFGAACASFALGDRRASGWISAACASNGFNAVLVAVSAYQASRGRQALAGAFYVDGLSGVFLIAVAFVYATVAVYSIGYLQPEIGHIRLRRIYWPLLNLFGLALVATPMVANLGVLRVAVELTTVVSALLVTSEGSDPSLEATATEPWASRAGLGALALASLAIGIAAPWVVRVLQRGTLPIGGGAAIGHISRPGWLIEPGYAGFASISPTVLALASTGFALGAAALRYLVRRRGRRESPVWASGVAVTGRRAQYTSLGYSNMVRVIFNVVYRVRIQLRPVGDQRFPERLSMMRAEPRIFDPAWLYRPITSAFTRIADVVRKVQAGPLGLYLLYLLLAFVVLLLVAPRIG